MMNLFNFTLLEQQLGPLAYPLFLCSLLALIILIERLLVLGYQTLSGKLHHASHALLTQHEQAVRDLREEVAAVWLQKQQRNLCHGIRVLNIVALVAPLLGLLGTVIGLIQVFDTLGLHQGPIEPSMLAEGLGIAMKTTAAGLIIAVPAVLGAHGFQVWIDKLVHSIEHTMNIQNLAIDGVCVEALA